MTDKVAKPADPAPPNPFSKRYKHREGGPVSDACGEGRHAECTQDYTKCNCTYRGSHVTPHKYLSISGVIHNPDPAPVPKEHSGPYKMESRNDYQVCLKCGTRWFANEVLPCPKCPAAAPVDQQEGQRRDFEKYYASRAGCLPAGWVESQQQYDWPAIQKSFEYFCAGRAALTSQVPKRESSERRD